MIPDKALLLQRRTGKKATGSRDKREELMTCGAGRRGGVGTSELLDAQEPALFGHSLGLRGKKIQQ